MIKEEGGPKFDVVCRRRWTRGLKFKASGSTLPVCTEATPTESISLKVSSFRSTRRVLSDIKDSYHTVHNINIIYLHLEYRDPVF
jgi:hypothetical protein